jgi:type II secretory pathway component PulF
MKFKYQAKTKEGVSQVGFVEASDRDAATAILTSHELFVLSVEEISAPNALDNISGFFNRVRRKDLIIFARQLATLLEARLPLSNALKILYEQTARPLLKEAIKEISEDVDAGVTFSQAMARQGNIFPDYYVEMVGVAEVTGNLNEVSEFLADYTEKEGDLITKTTSALIYPAIVVGLFLVVGFILLTFVYPSLGSVFTENNVTLPWYTDVLLTVGTFLSKWWVAVVAAAAALGVVFSNYIETDEGKAVVDEAKLRLPIVRGVYEPVIMARFGNAAALLVHGGIPLAQALEIISHMLDNATYREVVHEIAEDVREGLLLSQAITKHPDFFPELVSQMVAVGETTGKIEEMFTRISGIYTRQADEMTDDLVDLIQPALMIGIGIMVGLLFASVLLPLYSLTEGIH